MNEYHKEVIHFCLKLLLVFSVNLGLHLNYLKEAFGGKEDMGMCIRIDYYPTCPDPDLTLDLSSHFNAGGLTFLLQNIYVYVKRIPDSLVVNLGDQ